MSNKMSLTRRVLNYMLDNEGITSWEAIKEFGATRLSGIIFNLRKRGYFIESVWEESKNRYGDDVRFVRYVLDKERTFNFKNDFALPEGVKVLATVKLADLKQNNNGGINTPEKQ